MRTTPEIVLAALAASLLAGCNIVGETDAEPLDAQVIHPGGAVLQPRAIRTGDSRTEVSVRIINGRDRDIELNAGNEQSYLLTDQGEKLLLVAPATNPRLSVPPGQTIDASLIFAGQADGSSVVMILNERSRADNVNTASPRFQISLPLERAGRGALAEQSALSGMRPNAVSQLRPRTSPGSGLGGAGQSVSELRVVEALETELGAVDTERGTMVSLAGDVTFDFDKATIRQKAGATLDSLAQLILASRDGAITIEGHTDARGDDDYNQRLSEERAEAVASYLATKGVPEARLRTRGLGASRPVAPNASADGSDDEAGRQRNRRVEVILPGRMQSEGNEPRSRLEPAS